MKREEFIARIKVSLRDSTVEEFFNFFNRLPGRKPRAKDVRISEWIKNLDETDKKVLEDIIYENVDSTIFSFLCILDHVRFIEDAEEKTTFELYAVKNGEKILINDSKSEELHNLYNSLVLEEE